MIIESKMVDFDPMEDDMSMVLEDEKNAPEGAKTIFDDGLATIPKYTPLEEMVQELIRKASADRPIRRTELSRKTGIDDRTVRKTIEGLRRKGERILSGERGGYYYAENEGQYIGWRASITSRMVSMSAMLWAMDRHTDGQMEMEVAR